MLSNSHAIFHDPVPCLENVIHVGGLHINHTKPLPTELNTCMNKEKQEKKMPTKMPRVYGHEYWIINDDSALNGLFICTYLTNSHDYLKYVVYK